MGFGSSIYPSALEVKPHERFLAIPFNFSLSGNSSSRQRYDLSKSYDFTTVIVNASSTGVFKLQITDVYTSETLFTDFVRGNLITGDGKDSFVMPKPHTFLGGRTIQVEATDLSGNANTIQVVLIGYKDLLVGKTITVASEKGTFMKKSPSASGIQYYVDRLFALPFNFTMAGSTYSDTYPVSRGSDFMCEILNSYSARDFTLQIRDEFITEDMFISPVRNTLITGDGQNSFVLPRPYIFEGGTTIKITITDTDPAGTSTPVQFVMIGYKIVKTRKA